MSGGCGCGGGSPIANSPAVPMRNDIEYVVLIDGEYTDPFPTLDAAFEYAYANGGQARSRAKITT